MSEPRVRRAEIAVEQAHVDRTYVRLAELRTQAEAMRAKGYEIGHGAQREAVFERASMLYERDMMVFHANQTLQTLDAEYEGLVFGRLDQTDSERVYVGRIGVRDAEFNNLVTDWRAPAAAAFYQATAESPMDVVRRRVIRCSGQSVLDIDDDVLMPESIPEDMNVVGEGALMAALGRARGDTMRDIVATIQKEQDEVIRAPWRGVTEITGGPGTGKTAVALHRAAYLLYRYRRQLGGAGVLVIGPSGVFTNYISRVLPSMGESNVELRALGQVLDGLNATRHDPAPLAAVKGSLRMRRVLSRALRATPPDAPTQMRIVYKGEVLKLDSKELDRLRRKLHGHSHPPNRSRVRAAETLLEALADKAESYAEADGRDVDRRELITELGERLDFHRFLVVWWPVLYPAQVLRWLADERRLARAARGVLDAREIALLSASLADTEREWTVADVALLDELRVLLGPPPRRRRRKGVVLDAEQTRDSDSTAAGGHRPDHYDEYTHIVVDEAQDLSPMQWRMVGRRGKHASWTVVGDPLQSSWPSPEEAATARDHAFGARTARRRYTLRTNYRNSAEIFALAADVVVGHADPGDLPDAVRATDLPPQVRRIDPATAETATQAAAKELLDEVEGTVGVICAMDRVEEVRGWLSRHDERLKVVGSLDAKGLEYDGVVLLEPGELISESLTGRRVLYVALTRATQRLTVLASDDEWRG